MKKFYQINSWAVGGPLYPWSSGYGPLSEMPFIEALPVIWREWIKGPLMGQGYPPGMSIDGGGKIWSDFIGNSGGAVPFFVSERVISDLKTIEVNVWRKTEMPIASIKSKRLKSLPYPKYYVIEAEPGIKVDYEASGVPLDGEGSPLIKQRDKNHQGPLTLRLDTWNGEDLVSQDPGATIRIICTEKVKELAALQKWTNVEFTPIRVI